MNLKLVIAALALSAPLVSAATMPAEVHGITAARSGADVVVSWDPVETETAYYRVYWSRLSILGNAGDYDDSEETDGPDPTITLKDLPSDSPLYMAVIAVSPDDLESPTFAEEAILMPVDPLSALPPLTATKVSPVGTDAFRLTFGQSVALALTSSADAFTVTGPDGETVPVTSVKLEERSLLVKTAEHGPGRFILRIAPNTMYGVPESLDQSLSVFTGEQELAFVTEITKASSSSRTTVTSSSARNIQAASSSSSSTPSVTLPRATTEASASTSSATSNIIRTIVLTPHPRTDGYADLEVSWKVEGDTAQLAGIVLAQSIDGGRTFGDWQPLTLDTETVHIARVPMGNFAVTIAAVSTDGTLSPAVTKAIMIAPEDHDVDATVVASLTRRQTPLTTSGPASAGVIFILAAGMTGVVMARRVPRPR